MGIEFNQALIDEYNPLIWKLVNSWRYSFINYEADDLYNLGLFHLSECAKKYDDTKGVKLSTFFYSAFEMQLYNIRYRESMQKHGRDLGKYSLDKVLVNDSYTLYNELQFDIGMDNKIFINDIVDFVHDYFKDSPKTLYIFHRYFFDDLSQRQIADEMGTTTSAVSLHVVKLREIIKLHYK